MHQERPPPHALMKHIQEGAPMAPIISKETTQPGAKKGKTGGNGTV